MNFVSDDEESPFGKIVRLDFVEIAALLPEVAPECDAYDILRDVLTTLGEQARERSGITH